jgi:low affinity Fe/Cu permease
MTFVLALALIVVWVGFGPVSHCANTWQLTVKTSTSLITFLNR